jgi:hypothetical protein
MMEMRCSLELRRQCVCCKQAIDASPLADKLVSMPATRRPHHLLLLGLCPLCGTPITTEQRQKMCPYCMRWRRHLKKCSRPVAEGE